jgi:hypothetical protein
MITHPPAVGDLPQPTQYNVLKQQMLLEIQLPQPVVVSRDDRYRELGWLRCEVCTRLINLNGGYLFLDDFICDLCMARLVASTGGAFAS